MSKFSTRIIVGARKEGLKRYINPSLGYDILNYKCVQGAYYQSKSNRLRTNQKYNIIFISLTFKEFLNIFISIYYNILVSV